jgi:hypothetical protein
MVKVTQPNHSLLTLLSLFFFITHSDSLHCLATSSLSSFIQFTWLVKFHFSLLHSTQLVQLHAWCSVLGTYSSYFHSVLFTYFSSVQLLSLGLLSLGLVHLLGTWSSYFHSVLFIVHSTQLVQLHAWCSVLGTWSSYFHSVLFIYFSSVLGTRSSYFHSVYFTYFSSVQLLLLSLVHLLGT